MKLLDLGTSFDAKVSIWFVQWEKWPEINNLGCTWDIISLLMSWKIDSFQQ